MPGRTIRRVRPETDGRAGGDSWLRFGTKLAAMDVRLEDMSDADIIILVSKHLR
jgi:hypothetical protein